MGWDLFGGKRKPTIELLLPVISMYESGEAETAIASRSPLHVGGTVPILVSPGTQIVAWLPGTLSHGPRGSVV